MFSGPRRTQRRLRNAPPPCGEGDASSTKPASRDLEQAGGALAATDAHRDDGIFRAASLAFDQRVAGHACAAHAVGMADRDGATIDVEAIIGGMGAAGLFEVVH